MINSWANMLKPAGAIRGCWTVFVISPKQMSSPGSRMTERRCCNARDPLNLIPFARA